MAKGRQKWSNTTSAFRGVKMGKSSQTPYFANLRRAMCSREYGPSPLWLSLSELSEYHSNTYDRVTGM